MNNIPYIDLVPGTENIFNIVNPEVYTCMIQKFIRGVSEQPLMWINAFDESTNSPPINFTFLGVALFDGPTSWVGANFSVASQEICLSVLKELGWVTNVADDIASTVTNTYRIINLRSEAQNYSIRMLVTGAYRSEILPPHFLNINNGLLEEYVHKETVELIQCAYPLGIPDAHYHTLLSILIADRSIRVLSSIIAHIRGGHYSIYMGEVGNATRYKPDPDIRETVMKKLIACGYKTDGNGDDI